MRVLVFDTEATGLPKTKIINPDALHLWPHIVQFSYLIYDTELNDVVVVGDNIVKVGAGIIIPAEATAIHGITDQMSQNDGVSLSQVLRRFFRDLKTADRLVGHNISFDVNLVIVELLRMIYDAAPNSGDDDVITNKNNLHHIANYKNTYCTLQESIDLCAIKAVTKLGKEYNKFPKLVELHQKLFWTIPNNLHNSLTDILVTLRCYVMMTGKVDLNQMCNKYKELIRARNAL
jgi:DNA polymerase III epsilon subunit-like protein